MIIRNRFGQKVNVSVMHCDNCSKMISVAGIKIEELRFGEYQVKYFTCPHCGFRFHVSTFDDLQREVSAEQKKLVKRIDLGMKNHFQKRTIESYRHRMLNLTDKSRERQTIFLAPLGKRLLEGEALKDILNDLKGKDDGQENDG